MSGKGKKSKYKKKTFTYQGHRYYAYGRTEQEAIENRAIKKAEIEAGTIQITKHTPVKVWIIEWLSTYKEATVNSEWCKDIESMCENHIIPHIGYMQISAVKPLHLRKIFNNVTNYSSSFNSKLYDIIRQIFRAAHENDLIIKDPTTGLKKPPGVPPGTRRAITKQERRLTLQIAQTHRGGLFILLMLYCGLRPQEIVPLQWADIDFQQRKITISKALKSHGVVLPFPKTEAGRRSVPIPSVLLERLVADRGQPFDLVCTNTRGERYTKSSYEDLWKNFKREMNIAAGARVHPQKHQIIPPEPIDKDLTLYCYRHTYCTDLQDAGVPINVAKDLMGHKDISVTSKIYTHKSEISFADAAQKIDAHADVVSGVVQREKQLAKTANI